MTPPKAPERPLICLRDALRSYAVLLLLTLPQLAFAQLVYDEEAARDPAVRRVFSSLAILLLSALLVLVFAIGAYLLIRIGRAVAKNKPAAGPTEYVDAWSKYRISDAEVDAAMRELRDEHDDRPPGPPAGPPDTDSPRVH